MEKTGKLEGEVKAPYIIIEGEVEGKVIANEKVELYDTGKYREEILAPAVMISDIAFIDGTVKMMKEGMPAEEKEKVQNPQPLKENPKETE